MPRPAYMEPKLTDDDRIEIRRLRAEDPKRWTHNALVAKFNVHRSTIDRTLRKPLAVPFDKVHRSAIVTAEATGQIPTPALFDIKRQEWSRQLLTEKNLAKQQQLVNLIKSVSPAEQPEKEKTPLQALKERQEQSERARDIMLGHEEERKRLAAVKREETKASTLQGLDQAILQKQRRFLLGVLSKRARAEFQAEDALASRAA